MTMLGIEPLPRHPACSLPRCLLSVSNWSMYGYHGKPGKAVISEGIGELLPLQCFPYRPQHAPKNDYFSKNLTHLCMFASLSTLPPHLINLWCSSTYSEISQNYGSAWGKLNGAIPHFPVSVTRDSYQPQAQSAKRSEMSTKAKRNCSVGTRPYHYLPLPC